MIDTHEAVSITALITVVGIAFVAFSGGVAAQEATQNVVIEPQESTLGINETTTADVVLTNADGGIGTFDDISVSLNDTSVARIDSAVTPIGAATATANESQAIFSIEFGGDTANSGDVRIGSINITSRTEGNTALNVGLAGDIFREDGSIYDISEVRDGTVAVEGPPQKLVVEPQQTQATTNGTITVSVQLTNVSGGVGTFDDISITVDNGSVASIRGASTPLNPATTTFTDSQATLSSNVGADTVDTGDVTLGSLTLTGASVGRTDLSVTIDGRIYREDGTAYTLDSTRNGTVDITDAPEINGVPTDDTDDDGKVDDLNGNDRVDRGDAQALFANLDNSAISGNANLFDYNGNGRVDRGDVQALFNSA